MLTEVEAYDGPLDLASNGRTPRTEVMFGPTGIFSGRGYENDKVKKINRIGDGVDCLK